MIGKQRNFGLDVIRAISIILVLAAHRFTFPVELGIVGVQIFFVLSGFLIGQILINDFKDGGSFSKLFKFWKRRWYRTLPLYYLILILKILIYGNPYGWKMIVYFLFLQANFVGIDFFAVSWSLVVEEWFYLFLPIATFMFFARGIDPKRFVMFLFGCILFFLSARFFWNYFHKGIIIYQFDCLLLGVLLALFKLHYQSFYLKLNSLILFLSGVAGIVFFTIILGDIANVPVFDPFHRVIWYFLISICIAFIIPYAEQSVFINQSIKNIRPLYTFFTWTSILTYSIYLIHAEVFTMRFDIPEFFNVVLQALVLYSISFLLYSLYEHPMMSLRERFSVQQYINSAKALLSKS
jgi:peptidoglycan/LPS O-acetylase OafA/YrhL